jgi:hypothetical protein
VHWNEGMQIHYVCMSTYINRYMHVHIHIHTHIHTHTQIMVHQEPCIVHWNDGMQMLKDAGETVDTYMHTYTYMSRSLALCTGTMACRC